jgi:hypothetical protein
MEQWKRLHDAGSKWPDFFVESNSKAKPFRGPPKSRRKTFAGAGAPAAASSGEVWFTKSREGVDITALKAEIDAAEVGVLFLMFMPGGKGLLPTVRVAAAKPGL